MKRIRSEQWVPRGENEERDLGSIQRLKEVQGRLTVGSLPAFCIGDLESMGQGQMLSLAGIGQWKLSSRFQGRWLLETACYWRLGSEDHKESQKDLSNKRLQVRQRGYQKAGKGDTEPGREYTGGALISQTRLKEVFLHSPQGSLLGSGWEFTFPWG